MSSESFKKVRRIVVLNFLQEGTLSSWSIETGGIHFEITEHRIGFRAGLAEQIIRRMDGLVDGICLSGIHKEIGIGQRRINHPIFLRLLRTTRLSPIYVADDVRDVFGDWTIKRALRAYPNLFNRKRVLFHCAIMSHALQPILESGATVLGADPIVISKTPVILRGLRQIQAYASAASKFIPIILRMRAKKVIAPLCSLQLKALERGIKQADVFVTFSNLIGTIPDLSPLKGKILIIDYLTPEEETRVRAASPALVITLLPEHSTAKTRDFRHFSVLAAVVDQMRLAEGGTVAFSEYLLNWFSKTGVAPSFPRKDARLTRKCAFIIHALSEADLWKTPGLRKMSSAPALLRSNLIRGLELLPPFQYGSLTGVESIFNGEKVECEIFALPSTPGALLKADPEAVYRKLIRTVDIARERGASIVGLGAYTKVIGDAGVTVARKASLPVTNGNSYSAATTLWAAHEAVKKMGLIRPAREGERLKAKAMVIGATGGIGRVSALLLSLVFDEIVLAANRVDKLLELQDELKQLAPEVKVQVTTLASREARGSDLILIATSNQSGSVLDMEEVKPGAVICDCSRPLDIRPEDARKRPDVLVIESGEVLLPGAPRIDCDIGLPKPIVYACLAETVLLTLEGRYESFSLSKNLSLDRVKEIYKMGLKHGAQLSVICGPLGIADDELIRRTRELALARLPQWQSRPGLISTPGSRERVEQRESV